MQSNLYILEQRNGHRAQKCTY